MEKIIIYYLNSSSIVYFARLDVNILYAVFMRLTTTIINISQHDMLTNIIIIIYIEILTNS
jgi:hypothetical protein